MLSHEKARFRSIGAALRFYFRASHILTAEMPAILAGAEQRPPDGLTRDFVSVRRSLQGLDPARRFLLGELYGPTCFGEPRRTAARACEAVRRRFPHLNWTPRTVSRLRRESLARLEREFAAQGLIAAYSPPAARSRHGDQTSYAPGALQAHSAT